MIPMNVAISLSALRKKQVSEQTICRHNQMLINVTERDGFAKALPAPTKAARTLHLRKRG